MVKFNTGSLENYNRIFYNNLWKAGGLGDSLKFEKIPEEERLLYLSNVTGSFSNFTRIHLKNMK